MRHLLFSLFLLSLCTSHSVRAQETEFQVTTLGFYNLENLFDTLDAPNKRDGDFTPEGRNKWNSEKYEHKLNQLSTVIKDLGTSLLPDGMAAIGVSEVENRAVLEDLVAHKDLQDRNYQIVFEEGPDKRGIDVGFLYHPKYFKLIEHKSHTLVTEDTAFYTRDQLHVVGELLGERVHVIVAHWPSRSGGQKRSEPKRIAAAELGRQIVDDILAKEPNANILYMGDLNDDPVNKSLTKAMKATGDKQFAQKGKMFNPMYDLYNKGVGSLAWRDTWNLFDQVLLSPELLDNEQNGWQYHSTRVYNKTYLTQSTGNFKGYPFRTFAGGAWTGGYSDHFPVYVILKRPLN